MVSANHDIIEPRMTECDNKRECMVISFSSTGTLCACQIDEVTRSHKPEHTTASILRRRLLRLRVGKTNIAPLQRT